MKRLLQGLALVQVLLVLALGVRIVRVWSTPLPAFGDIPELPARTALPPPRPKPKISKAVTDGVVDLDLFDTERGQGIPDILVEGDAAPPVPPPSTVKLMGVMMLGGDPVGILLDTSVQGEQQAVRKGDMFGEYEVGDIDERGLLLLGSKSQQFQIPLRVDTSAVAPAKAPARPAAAAKKTPPGRNTPAARANPPAPRQSPQQRAATARQRAQAIAQRNAEMRRGQRAGQDANEETEKGTSPVQARLQALRQLREAARNR